MSILRVDSINKSFDKGKNLVVDSISFEMKAPGSSIAIVGESGSGKTTICRIIAGLETADTGSVVLKERTLVSDTVFVAPEKRKVGMVFQDYALFPNLTVAGNVAYGISKKDKERVTEMLALVNLSDLAHRYPHELSGGQQQRVALARALAPKPDLLILDEPFSNLDAMLRVSLRQEVFSILKKTGVSAIFITHDTQDALAVADEILILKDGKLVQKGTAEQLYKAPENAYVAGLFSPVFQIPNAFLQEKHQAIATDKTYWIRQDKLEHEGTSPLTIKATIHHQVYTGDGYLLHLQTASGWLAQVKVAELPKTKELTIGFAMDDLMVL